jgi:hypothetical protein
MKGEITGFIFWPKGKINQAFQEANKAMGTPGELTALRVFHARMSYHLKTAADIGAMDPEPNILTIARYERPRLDAEIARIKGRSNEA